MSTPLVWYTAGRVAAFQKVAIDRAQFDAFQRQHGHLPPQEFNNKLNAAMIAENAHYPNPVIPPPEPEGNHDHEPTKNEPPAPGLLRQANPNKTPITPGPGLLPQTTESKTPIQPMPQRPAGPMAAPAVRPPAPWANTPQTGNYRRPTVTPGKV